MERVILLGAGNGRERVINVNDRKGWEGQELVTLDIDPSAKPDIVWDLNKTPWPFEDNSADEIHAYEVFEHLGQQGDVESFFATFYECWRILKPNGKLACTVPMWNSLWAFSDPGHRRIISVGTLAFLSLDQYHLQVGKTPMADYRSIWKGDFEPEFLGEGQDRLVFVMNAHKPVRTF
jgi:SAM-dependent methyltransferase